jgi:hypothetical protein
VNDLRLQATLLRPTLGNEAWMKRNIYRIVQVLPDSPTLSTDNSFLILFAFTLRAIGVHLTEPIQLAITLRWLSRLGYLSITELPVPSLTSFTFIRHDKTRTN